MPGKEDYGYTAYAWIGLVLVLLLATPFFTVLSLLAGQVSEHTHESVGWVILGGGILLYFGAGFVVPMMLAERTKADRRRAELAQQQRVADCLIGDIDAQRNTGPYVLYLRPFTLDGLIYWKEELGGLVDTGIAHAVTLDAALFDYLDGKIPIICLDSDARDYGAAGIRTDDAQWLADVKRLMCNAGRIVLVPGDSAGILDELYFLWKTPDLHAKSYIVMPPKRSGFFVALTWESAQKNAKLLGIRLPDYDAFGAIFTLSGRSMHLGYRSVEDICHFIAGGLKPVSRTTDTGSGSSGADVTPVP